MPKALNPERGPWGVRILRGKPQASCFKSGGGNSFQTPRMAKFRLDHSSK